MRAGQTLKLSCEPCERRAALSYADAVATFGPDATPMDIRAKAVCKVCGGKAKVWI